MKKYAVIVAGGNGSRMGSAVPKQFLLLRDKPVLWYTLETFLEAYADLEVILVVPEEHVEASRVVVDATRAPQRVRLTMGGTTRFYSVQRGLALIEGEAVVFVQDGVRCLTTKELIWRCYEQAVSLGSAIPAVASKDSVRLVKGEGSEVLDRSRVKLVQTPQTFLNSILVPSYHVEFREEFTDEATVVEAAGHAVHLVEGDVNNIKITTPIDLVIAEKLLA
ncbi:MAG: 2-C-methyl-D-erythritol 4-phosphate cytidylyltransferase [Bacteroidetes bacterium]|nr:2-C-methyl-D-erythritol 4-phosphate cytidylyltransferase [Bacteroidota bacterium]